MIVRRVMESKTQQDLAIMFGTSAQTVARRLADARGGMLQELTREMVSEQLIPLAVGVLENELRKGNYDAAKDVLYGLQILQKGGTATIKHVTSTTPTLDQIRKERAKAIDAEILPPDGEKV